jgi:PAS domain S-box-containing protein
LVDEFITSDFKEKVAGVLARACEGSETDNFEFPLLTKTGDIINILLNATTRRDASGAVTGVVGVGQDITKFKQLYDEAAHVADDLTRFIETANAPIFGIDTEGKVTEWNRMAAHLSGWGKEESLGQHLVRKFITPEYQDEVSKVLSSALYGDESANYEFPLFTRDGQRREILLNATTRRDQHRKIIGVIGVGQDITELRQANAEQQRVADDLSRLIETANAPIFGVDVEGKVTEWNRKASELSGFPKDESMGQLLVEKFVTDDYKRVVHDVLKRAYKGEETANFEFPLMTRSQERIAILLNATPRRDASGNVTGVVGVGQDITSLRHAMHETGRVADDLMRLIDTANAPILGIDTNWNITEWNVMASTIAGWHKKDIVGMPLLDVVISDDYREEVEQVLKRALEGNETANYMFPLFTKSGQRHDILLNATSRRGPDGEIIGVVGVGQDITELNAITAEHERVADDLARIIETANAPIFGVDANGNVTEWNGKAAEISGFSKDDTLGKHLVQEFITDEYKAQVQAVLNAACDGQETANFTFPLVTKTNRRVEVLLNATPRKDATGKVIGMVGVGQDITELKMSMAHTRTIASELLNLVDTANAPIVGVDLEGCVTEWSGRVVQVTGFTKEEIVGKEFLSYVSEGCRAELHRVIQDALKGGSTLSVEIVFLSKRSRDVQEYTSNAVFLLSAAPRSELGKITGVICIGQDITLIRELDAKKAEFMATVTHELRSPLHGIIGLSDNILADNVMPSLRKPLQMVNNCARRLLDLVTNIMDLSVMVQDKERKLSRDPVHIARIVEEVLTLTSCAVDKAGRSIKKPEISLLSDLEDNLPIIEADAHYCTQVLYNLVTNALKFTDRGHVKVSAAADNEREMMTVRVADTGLGIADQNLEKIFNPFEQEDQSESRRYEGLGLGLAISREVAVKHGGSLTVESALGKGSTFILEIPFRMPQVKSEAHGVSDRSLKARHPRTNPTDNSLTGSEPGVPADKSILSNISERTKDERFVNGGASHFVVDSIDEFSSQSNHVDSEFDSSISKEWMSRSMVSQNGHCLENYPGTGNSLQADEDNEDIYVPDGTDISKECDVNIRDMDVVVADFEPVCQMAVQLQLDAIGIAEDSVVEVEMLKEAIDALRQMQDSGKQKPCLVLVGDPSWIRHLREASTVKHPVFICLTSVDAQILCGKEKIQAVLPRNFTQSHMRGVLTRCHRWQKDRRRCC